MLRGMSQHKVRAVASLAIHGARGAHGAGEEQVGRGVDDFGGCDCQHDVVAASDGWAAKYLEDIVREMSCSAEMSSPAGEECVGYVCMMALRECVASRR